MKTNSPNNFNRYTFQDFRTDSSRPQSRRSRERVLANRNNPGLETAVTPTEQRSKHFLIATETAFPGALLRPASHRTKELTYAQKTGRLRALVGHVKSTGPFMRTRIVRAAAALILAAIAAPPSLAQASAQDSQARGEDLEARARAAVSQIRGTLQVPGLQKPVRVQRDHWGVAHIYAENQHDLFFAQGFVVAQDRIFQMELWKRSGQGRLAEVLGPSAVQRDINARLLQYRGDWDAEYASYASDTKEILEAFTSGINTYIAEIQKSDWSGLPIEFQIAGFRPEPWKPDDCLNRMAAFSMTDNAKAELKHAEVVNLLGAKKASGLFDFDPQVELDPAPGVDFSGLTGDLLQNLVGSDARIDFAGMPREGSNDWTISGASTATGKPLLANDPHRVMAEPSLRYIVHLVAPGWNVIGAGEPGLPGVADGHNESIAWGFTIFGLDQQDLYIEEINPRNPDEYRTDKGWEPFETRLETIEVRGGGEATVHLRWTRHGPVVWSDGKRALALRWVGAEPGTAGYLGSLSLDRAQNWKDFESAMTRWKVPSENIVYADRSGNIGEHYGSRAGSQELDGTASRAGRRWVRMGWLCAELRPAAFLQPRGRICGHREPQDDSGWLPLRHRL